MTSGKHYGLRASHKLCFHVREAQTPSNSVTNDWDLIQSLSGVNEKD